MALLELLLPPPSAAQPVATAGTRNKMKKEEENDQGEDEEPVRLARIFTRGRTPDDLRDGLSFFLRAYIQPQASRAAASVLPAADRALLKRNYRLALNALRPIEAGV
jgi:hypothetical protein